MSIDEIKGIARAIVPAIAAWAAAKGWFPSEMVGEITAAVVTGIAVIWSVTSKRKAAA